MVLLKLSISQVEIHKDFWWKGRFTAAGFIFSAEVTKAIRDVANVEQYYFIEKLLNETDPIFYDDKRYMEKLLKNHVHPMGQHIRNGMMVFVNPAVASRLEHVHLFAGDGCYKLVHGNIDGGVPCTGIDRLPAEYNGLLRCYRDHERSKAIGRKDISQMYWTCVSRKDTSAQ